MQVRPPRSREQAGCTADCEVHAHDALLGAARRGTYHCVQPTSMQAERLRQWLTPVEEDQLRQLSGNGMDRTATICAQQSSGITGYLSETGAKKEMEQPGMTEHRWCTLLGLATQRDPTRRVYTCSDCRLASPLHRRPHMISVQVAWRSTDKRAFAFADWMSATTSLEVCLASGFSLDVYM